MVMDSGPRTQKRVRAAESGGALFRVAGSGGQLAASAGSPASAGKSCETGVQAGLGATRVNSDCARLLRALERVVRSLPVSDAGQGVESEVKPGVAPHAVQRRFRISSALNSVRAHLSKSSRKNIRGAGSSRFSRKNF